MGTWWWKEVRSAGRQSEVGGEEARERAAGCAENAGRGATAARLPHDPYAWHVAETERYPAQALVEALKGHTVIDARCDGEGVDDVRLLLDDGTTIMIDAELHTSPASIAMAQALGRPPWPRLSLHIGGRELWPFEDA